MNPKLQDLCLQAVKACNGLDSEDAVVIKFAELVAEELLVDLEWLIATRQPASTYVQILKETEWLR